MSGQLSLGRLPESTIRWLTESPVPWVRLQAAKALTAHTRTVTGEAVRAAGEMLLRHWEEQGEKKYFLFGIGTDFRKLKFPLAWYNILHVLEVVSRIPTLRRDPRLLEMAGELAGMADEEGRFTPASIYRAYKGQDFADKKNPSPTITLFALRILKRLDLLDI